MRFNVNSNLFSQLHEVVEKVLIKEFSTISAAPLTVSDEIDIAYEYLAHMRHEAWNYDSHHRDMSLKPCINKSTLAGMIQQELCERLHVAYVNRAHAYRILFVMWVLSNYIEDTGRKRSWWEKTFCDSLPQYLDNTEYFKDTNCKYRLHVVLSQLPPKDGCLPLEFLDPIPIPEPKSNYPAIGHIIIQVYNNLNADVMNNENCVQIYNEVKKID